MLRSALSRRTLQAAAVGLGAVSTQHEKLSIYPSPEPELVLIDTPSELEKQIGVARTHATRVYNDSYARVQEVVSRWIGIEHAVEARIKALHAPDESLTPGLLYVAVATLAGSIVARSRGIPTRVILPPALFLASANHFLPKTSANVSDYAGALEDEYFPAFAQKHDVAKAHTAMTVAHVSEALKNSRAALESNAEKALDAIEAATGVKVTQAIRWGKSAEAAVVEQAHVAAHTVSEKVAVAETKARVRAEEIVESVKASAAKAEAASAKAAASANEKAAAAKEALVCKAEEVKEMVEAKVEEAKADEVKVDEIKPEPTPVEKKVETPKRLV